MVGKAMEPKSWFSKTLFGDSHINWGDRSSIHELLERARSGKYCFDAP